MASRQRPSPPPYGRRAVPPERTSTGTFGQYPPSSYDPYHARDARDSYTSPRTSGERVIPVSSETYRNGSLVSSNRLSNNYDAYNDPRRAVGDTTQRRLSQPSSSIAPAMSGSARVGPTVIHQNQDRPANTGGPRISERHERSGSYITPASSSGRREHRRTYSIEDGKRARLVGDRDNDYGREHRRRDDPSYHLTGPTKRASHASDYLDYEYATPRDVFENTEPRRQTRRRGSVDAPSRERPTSLMESYAPTKSAGRDVGPPRATRDLEKVNNAGGVSRRESLREPVRSPPRHRVKPSYGSTSDDDNYTVAPRPRRTDEAYYEREPPYSPTRNNFDERRDSLRSSRKFEDVEVASRGFGIRAASVDPPPSHDEGIDSRSRYTAEPPPPPPDYPPDARRDDRKWEPEKKQRDRGSEYDRGYDRDHNRDYDTEGPRDREVDAAPRRRERDSTYDRPREGPPTEDEPKTRDHNYPQERERDGYPQEPSQTREKNTDDVSDASKRDRPRENGGQRHESNAASVALPVAAAAGAAAYAASGATDRNAPDDDRSKTKESQDKGSKAREERSAESPDEPITRERHYVTKDDNRDTEVAAREEAPASSIDPDEEFRQRVQQEANRVKQAKTANSKEAAERPRSREPPRHRRDEDDLESDGEDGSRALALRPKSTENILDAPLTGEPAAIIENRENRVRIVEPPREKDLPRGILRKPTEKFPEYPNTTREGVAAHKDAKKEGVPEGAKWTKIARSMVNPQALKEADERFEERQDFVIVLRAITKEEIQKLADRTQEIRGEREHPPPHRQHRDRRHHRRYDYEDDNDGYDR